MDKEETKRIIALIKSAYPKQFEINPGSVTVYHWILGKLDYILAERATYQYLSEPHAFPPPPGIILSYAVALASPKYLDSEEAWSLAWGAAGTYGNGGALTSVRIRENGTSRLITEGRFKANKHLEKYPAVVKAVNVIGYDTLCECEEKSKDFLRKRFIEVYESAVDSEKVFRQQTLIGDTYVETKQIKRRIPE